MAESRTCAGLTDRYKAHCDWSTDAKDAFVFFALSQAPVTLAFSSYLLTYLLTDKASSVATATVRATPVMTYVFNVVHQ